MEMKYLVTIDGMLHEICIEADETNVTIDGRPVAVDFQRLSNGRLHAIMLDNSNYEFELVRNNGGFDIWHNNGQIRAEVSDEKSERFKKLMGASATKAKASALHAPMPGLVIKIEVEPGQHVKKGDGLVIIEAMKMENELKAHHAAVIKEIKIKPGQPVDKNQILIVFE